jgi:TRAP-type transport system small permease protein
MRRQRTPTEAGHDRIGAMTGQEDIDGPRRPAAPATLERGFFRGLEMLLVLLLAAMVVMVFGNVMLRWFADSGIQISEEMSRFCFVWLTFIGAVVVARENAHLGVDAMVGMFGPRGQRICMILSDLLVLLCCAVFFWGTWQQAPLNATNIAPVSGMNMLLIFGVGFFTSGGIGWLTALRLRRALTGRLRPGELEAFAGKFSEEDIVHGLKGKME